jgi:hypothetical protein
MTESLSVPLLHEIMVIAGSRLQPWSEEGPAAATSCYCGGGLCECPRVTLGSLPSACRGRVLKRRTNFAVMIYPEVTSFRAFRR